MDPDESVKPKTELWHMCHCSGKEETRATQVLARWTMAFGLLGFFLVLFGGLITRKGYSKQTNNDITKMQSSGPLILIAGGGLCGIAFIMGIILPCMLLHNRRKLEKNPLSRSFLSDGYPQVVELMDWGNITPTRTENSDTHSLDIRISEVDSVTDSQVSEIQETHRLS